MSVRLEAAPVQLQGTVQNVAPEVDPAARMVFVEASLELTESAGARILSGAVARVSLPDMRARR